MDANNGRDEEADTQRTPRARGSISTFLFLSFILFMLTSHNGDEFLARHQYQDALKSLTHQLSNFTAWMNGTTAEFTMDKLDDSIPPLLEAFHVQGKELDPYKESYYQNVTGFIHGEATLINITLPELEANQSLPWKSHAQKLMQGANATHLVERLGSWDWQGSTRLSLSVAEKSPADKSLSSAISIVQGRIEISDEDETDTLRLEFGAVHEMATGAIYGFAEPPGRHVDIRLLPSLVSPSLQKEVAEHVKKELEAKIEKLTELIDAGVIDADSSSTDNLKTTCPFTFFGRLHAAPMSSTQMQELEEEMQTPTGARTLPPPELSLDAFLLSKECGLLFELSKTEGLRLRVFSRKVTTYAGLTAILYFIILVLFTRQAERSRTPSGIARVSRWTFLVQTVMDVLSFAGHLTFAILADGRPSLSLVAPAFLSCIMFTYQGQFAALTHQIQGPENFTPPAVVAPPPVATPSANSRTPTTNSGRDLSQGPASSREGSPSPVPIPSAPSPATTGTAQPVAPASDNNRPPPTTPTPPATAPATTTNDNANRPPTTFFAFFIHQIRSDPQARMWLLMIAFLMVLVRVLLSPTLSVIFVIGTYSSIWFPQIARSVRRGRSSGLSKEYVLGTTGCRLLSLLYFMACPKNVLDVDPRPWVWWLALNVVIQALFVVLQDTFGPTFFLPQRYAKSKTYDYHPVIPLPDSESPEQSLGDCGICMDAILVDPSLRHRRKSLDSKEQWSEKGPAPSSSTNPGVGSGVARVFGAMQIGSSLNARKNYSLAPCSHLFHTECLEKWLAIKNICPQCRRPLPPL